MSNNKSSVEWLIDNYFGGIENCSPMFRRKIAEAKAMHKEEIINAHTIGYVIGGGNGYIHEPEQYYNETFGGNNEQDKSN
jgi:hypothetical protein